VSFSVCPVKHGYRAHFNADPVAGADIPVNCYVVAVDAEFLRRLHRSPNVMTLMLINDGSCFLEVRVDWQNRFTLCINRELGY
jgi:hypothetical protein